MNGRNGAKAPRRSATHRDQAFVRELNDRVAAERPSGMFIEFACECARRGCSSAIPLTVDEYEAVRRHRWRFAVLPGHDGVTGARVIERYARYIVVETPGAALVPSPSRELAVPVPELSVLR